MPRGLRRKRLLVNGEEFDPRRIQRALDRAYEMTHGRMPAEAQRRVAEIRQRILQLVPRAGEFPVGSVDLFLLQRTAVEYLPESLEAYLALPPSVGTNRVLVDGKTPLQVLMEQLDLIEARMHEITESVWQWDSDRLLVQGRFLEDRLGHQPDELKLPGQ